MKSFKLNWIHCGALTLAIFAQVWPLCASAKGGGFTGGGKGVVCRKPDRSIKSVELLDLWEARELYGRRQPWVASIASVYSVEEIVNSGVLSLQYVMRYPYEIRTPDRIFQGAEALAYKLKGTAVKFYQPNWANVKRLRKIRLALTPDSFEAATPDEPGCDIEQIVQYKDSGFGGMVDALINEDLFDKMDNTNRAALALHEALYAELRKLGETNSIRTRRAIGAVMNGRSFLPIDRYLQGPHITCQQPDRTSRHINQTIVHYVSHNGLITGIPEFFDGLPFMGVEPGFVGTSQTIEQFYKQSLGRGVDIRPSASDVDFDALLQAEAVMGDPNAIELTLVNSASGVKTPRTVKLKCGLIP